MKKGKQRGLCIALACMAVLIVGTFIYARTHEGFVRNCRSYATAQVKYFQGEYGKAAAILKSCGGFLNSKELSDKCFYKEGEEQLEAKEYQEAITNFLQVYEYSDSKERIREAYYLQGCDEMVQSFFYKAEVNFRNAGDYKDAKEKWLEAQYYYVTNDRDFSNETTRAYLANLMEANYKDSKEIYEELNQLAVEIFRTNNDGDYRFQDFDVLKNNRTIYLYLKISCGVPKEEYKLKVRAQFPDESVFTDEMTATLGEEWYFEYEPNEKLMNSEGEATFTVMDENDNVLAEKTVMVQKERT